MMRQRKGGDVISDCTLLGKENTFITSVNLFLYPQVHVF